MSVATILVRLIRIGQDLCSEGVFFFFLGRFISKCLFLVGAFYTSLELFSCIEGIIEPPALVSRRAQW